MMNVNYYVSEIKALKYENAKKESQRAWNNAISNCISVANSQSEKECRAIDGVTNCGFDFGLDRDIKYCPLCGGIIIR